MPVCIARFIKPFKKKETEKGAQRKWDRTMAKKRTFPIFYFELLFFVGDKETRVCGLTVSAST